MKSGTCPKCGSNDLTDPTKTRLVAVRMISCRQCLYAELYVGSPDEIKRTWRTIALMYLICAVIVAACVAIPFFLS